MSAHALSISIILSSSNNTLALHISSTVRLVLNTTSLLWDFDSPHLYLLLMSNSCIRKFISFTVYCYKLASNLTLVIKTMWPCKECVSWSLFCHVDSEFFKYFKCVLHTSYKCDLVISEVKWAQVQHEWVWLCIEV